MNRFAYSIFSDDVRHEIGNKRSIIGIYSGKMFVSSFPILLPKLCISISIVTSFDKPFSSVKFRLLVNDDVFSESALNEEHFARQNIDQSAAAEIDSNQVFIANIETQISPFPVEKASMLRVRIIADDEELKGGALSIELAPVQTQ
jgi:hypothetical protein